MKTCSKCGISKPENAFYKDKYKKSGLSSLCKDCKALYLKANKEYKQQYDKKYAENNKEKHIKYRQVYYKNNKNRLDKINSENHKQWYQNNKTGLSEYNREYRLRHKEQMNNQRKNRYSSDIQFQLACRLRARLFDAMSSLSKTGSAVRDLGCTIPELIIHLESQFKPGMTWTNRNLWHIDHIRPLASFDLTDRTQLLEACNYKNLQPLWAQENISKGDKY